MDKAMEELRKEKDAEISEKNAEIERLKVDMGLMFSKIAEQSLQLTRAADELEGKYQNENVGLNHEEVVREFKSFIAQVRKAAG
jgi:hypothetical protein